MRGREGCCNRTFRRVKNGVKFFILIECQVKWIFLCGESIFLFEKDNSFKLKYSPLSNNLIGFWLHNSFFVVVFWT